MDKRSYKFLLFFLLLILFGLNYPFLEEFLQNSLFDYETGVVERVIDGDTLVINGSSIRLLGINTPEKGELYYQEAKDFLENKTLYKIVKLESAQEDKDRYDRKLRYVFIGKENVNLELVEKGLANTYFPSGKDRYYNEFKNAWKKCAVNNLNLCEKSLNACASCLELKELNVEEDSLIIANNCGYECNLTNWSIKDEGRKRFIFPNFTLKDEVEVKVGNNKNQENVLFWKGEEYVWTKTGDTLFFRDNDGKLVFWYNF